MVSGSLTGVRVRQIWSRPTFRSVYFFVLFFITLNTVPRRPWGLELGGTKVYEPGGGIGVRVVRVC